MSEFSRIFWRPQENRKQRSEIFLRFFQFINYDWGIEPPFEAPSTQATQTKKDKTEFKPQDGTKQWQIYKDVHEYSQKSEQERQFLKKEFYQKHIDPEFIKMLQENQFNKESLDNFNQEAQLMSNLGIVGLQVSNKANEMQFLYKVRRILYLIYVLLRPIKLNYTWSPYLLAIFLSIYEALTQKRDYKELEQLKNDKLDEKTKQKLEEQQTSRKIQMIFSEEVMNIVLLFFLVISGPIPKFLIHFSLSIWAIIHITDFCYESQVVLRIPALLPYLEVIKNSKIELMYLKNIIEFALLILSIPFIFIKQAALILPVFLYQYIKLKYAASLFTKGIMHSALSYLEMLPILSQIVALYKRFGFIKQAKEQEDDREKVKSESQQKTKEEQKVKEQNENKNLNKKQENNQDSEEIEELNTDHMKKIN